MLDHLRITVRKIPRGKVATYGQVATASGYPGAARQVAWALHSSSGMGLPWHRVVGAGGYIRLPGHLGMEQRFRLEMEGVRFRGQRIDMAAHEFQFAANRRRKASQR
jgi:methylated-DNA-protein-cysteine methyltransferase-like protein